MSARILLPDTLSLPQPGTKLALGSVYGCASPLLIGELGAIGQRPLLVVVPTVGEAELLEHQLRYLSSASVALLPDPETLPYDSFSPHQDLISRRLATLTRILDQSLDICIVAASTLFYRLPPQAYIRAKSLSLQTGQTVALADLRGSLADNGYERVNQVSQHGEYAVRGSLIDLYPMGLEHPVRIDFFDEEIDSLRLFDPDTQLSGERVSAIETLPARDFATTEDSIRSFRQRYREQFEGNPSDSIIYREVSDGRYPGGIENYLPLFFDSTDSIWDYLPDNTLVVTAGGATTGLQAAWAEISQRFEQYRHDIERPALPPEQLFVSPVSHEKALVDFGVVELVSRKLTKTTDQRINLNTSAAPAALVQTHSAAPIEGLLELIRSSTQRILISAESPGRRELLTEMLTENGQRPVAVSSWQAFLADDAPLGLMVSPLDKGARLHDADLCVLAEHELFGTRTVRRSRRKVRDPEAILTDLSDLNPGSPVVHIDYGVGRYLGLSFLSFDGVKSDYLTLEYAGGDLLHVPVGSLQLISRYSGTNPEHAPLHRLGTDQWARARRKAAEQIRDVAAEMLDLHATRASRTGRSFHPKQSDYELFSAAFPFELTEDQARAVDDTLADLRSTNPMDRLVCGDVGFGKTEVALRAAFAAAICGSQVAILAPTTLLAQQHFQTFSDRFADWPVNVAVLSRFRTARETKQVIADLGAGKVDIVIGTHKLLQPDIKFKDLGLVIVDEEHRFGVRQKEQLKNLRAEVDILTLTATPIPRTLNMAMGELRELSLITTPPETRLSIKTFVTEWEDALLREACQRELKRGGQVYFVHNRIEDIDKQARRIESIMPDASVRVAHGKMREQELEQIMLDFYHRRFHILVCTAIIESGIDIPSANTIVINRADRFGLSQLHQLRGRVGRSHHKAYAYLLTPPENALTADAQKRLTAIESMEDLGAGFVLATHDLEIRGAGELLGEQQTGQMQQIGFSLYTEMLTRAVTSIRNGETPDIDEIRAHGPEVNLRIPALLPEDYMPDIQMRLTHYKRISGAPDDTALNDLKTELIDRFGLLPEQTQNLFRQTRLKLHATALGLKKIEASPGGVSISFDDKTQVAPELIVQKVQNSPQRYRFDGARLHMSADLELPEDRFVATEQLIAELSTPNRPSRAAG